MTLSLNKICFNIWKSSFERQGIKQKFVPVFTRYIGVEHPDEYNDILKTFLENFKENNTKSIYFDGTIPMEVNFDLIQNVKTELSTMNINDMSHQEIYLFSDKEINDMFLSSLDYIIPIALKKENFLNNSIRNNFITKLILWTFIYVKNIDFSGSINPKCLYYGNITRHEVYFLMLLHLMTFDVIYINPLKDDFFDEIDELKLSKKYVSKQLLPVDSLKERSNNGNVIEYNESITKQIEQQMEEEMFTNTGIFKPWQFRNGNTISLFVDSTVIDLDTYWCEPAKIRNNFSVKGKNVTVPVLFQKIEGEYRNTNEYYCLVTKCISQMNTLVINNQNDIFYNKNITDDEKLQLMFYQLNDKTFNIDEVKKMPFYQLSKYKTETQNFILNKMNEVLKDENLFAYEFSKKQRLDFVSMIITLSDKIIRLIDNFDFPNDIPKVTVFLNNDEVISNDNLILLGFLHKVAFDIVIFNPSGGFNTESVISNNRISINRLDTMNYNRTLSSLKEKKQSWFDKFFN